MANTTGWLIKWPFNNTAGHYRKTKNGIAVYEALYDKLGKNCVIKILHAH
jgi:hypothetical protein